MKKFFALLMIASVGITKTNNDDAGQAVVAAFQVGTQLYAAHKEKQDSLPTQKNFLKKLRWMFENDPLFFKRKDGQDNLDYYVAVLPEHMKTLESKIEAEKIASNLAKFMTRLKSRAMINGVITSTLATLGAYATYFVSTMRSETMEGVAVARKMKDRTDASFLNFVGQNQMYSAFVLGLTTMVFAAVAGKSFSKVCRYAERLVERLERDKKFLKILEEEKALIESKKLTADPALTNLFNALVDAINTVVQGTAAPAVAPETPVVKFLDTPAASV